MQINIPKEYKHLFEDQDSVTEEDLFYTIDELNYELTRLQKEYDNFQKNVEDNYKFIPVEEQIGYDRENW